MAGGKFVTRPAMKALNLLSIPLLLSPSLALGLSSCSMFGVADPSTGGPCFRPYAVTKNACGTTSDATIRQSTVQTATGSPNLGLVPTMKTIAP